MQDRYTQIRYMAANYSRLQGLRAVPVGILAVFVSIWSLYNHGPSADLSAPILVAIAVALLYWLTDRYYNRALGQVKQTPLQRKREWIASAIAAILGLLAFVLDTTEILSISTLGLVFAASFFEYLLRADRTEWRKIFLYYPENIIAAILIVVISLLPLFGISWWENIGIRSQVVGVFLVVGIVILVTGIWGHIHMMRDLSPEKAKSNDITL
jgi:uncharacterized membrane protein